MRQIAPGVFLENKYPAVYLGAVAGDGRLLLVDSPIRAEDGREWLAQLSPRGAPRYVALLDQHPDRILGSRYLDLVGIAHDATRAAVSEWPDTFKGASQPIGAEVDRIKRVTGVSRAVPELTFAGEMTLKLGDRRVTFRHRPGPTPGAMWVVVPDAQVAFIGDAVTISEPPYVGDADVDAWMAALDELRGSEYSEIQLVASRDGLVDRDAINDMARFLRKIPFRLSRMEKSKHPLEAAASIASELLGDFKVPASRKEIALLRLEAGFRNHHIRLHPTEE